MLTRDEKEKLLALRARGFSYDKIAGQLGYSPTTVRKVCREARQGGAEASGPGQPGQGLPPDTGPAILAEYREFQARQALEERRAELAARVEGELEALRETAPDVEGEGLGDVEWSSLKQRQEQRLEWLVEKVRAVSTPQEANQLVGLMEEVLKQTASSLSPYRNRVDQMRRERQDEMVERSRKLLTRQLRMPGLPRFPRSVVGALKEQLLVKDEAQARQVQRAVLEYAARLPYAADDRTWHRLWRPFLAQLKEERWAFIRELSWCYRERVKNLQRWQFGEWLTCGRCFTPMRVAAGIMAWFPCSACGSPVWKGAPGPPALPPGWVDILA